MGVYIKGMEMPTSCGNCFFDTHCDNWRLRNWGAPPPDDCPLVPVPQHGRLIDADEFLKRAIGTKCFRGDYAFMLEELVGESSAILKAEEGE